MIGLDSRPVLGLIEEDIAELAPEERLPRAPAQLGEEGLGLVDAAPSIVGEGYRGVLQRLVAKLAAAALRLLLAGLGDRDQFFCRVGLRLESA